MWVFGFSQTFFNSNPSNLLEGIRVNIYSMWSLCRLESGVKFFPFHVRFIAAWSCFFFKPAQDVNYTEPLLKIYTWASSYLFEIVKLVFDNTKFVLNFLAINASLISSATLLQGLNSLRNESIMGWNTRFVKYRHAGLS